MGLFVELENDQSANNPAAGKAGIALLFAIVHHRPGLPEQHR